MCFTLQIPGDIDYRDIESAELWLYKEPHLNTRMHSFKISAVEQYDTKIISKPFAIQETNGTGKCQLNNVFFFFLFQPKMNKFSRIIHSLSLSWDNTNWFQYLYCIFKFNLVSSFHPILFCFLFFFFVFGHCLLSYSGKSFWAIADSWNNNNAWTNCMKFIYISPFPRTVANKTIIHFNILWILCWSVCDLNWKPNIHINMNFYVFISFYFSSCFQFQFCFLFF